MANPPFISPEFQVASDILQYKPYPTYPSWLDSWDLSVFSTNTATALAAANEADDTADAAQATANTAITNAAAALAAASANLPRRGHFHSDEATYIAGTSARNIDGTYPYAAGLYTTTQNAHAEFYITCRAGSSITVSVLTQQINNAGILTLYLDGTLFGTTDLYSAVTVKATLVAHSVGPISAGDHTLAFKVLTKHASSAGYIMFLNLIQWRIT